MNEYNKILSFSGLLILIIFLLPSLLLPQNYLPLDDLDDEQRGMFLGGNLSFSGRPTRTVGISPVFGLHIFPDFGVGLGADYYYAKRNEDQIHSYGGKLFFQYHITKSLYAKSQFSYLNYNGTWLDTRYDSQYVPYLFVGGGFQRPISSRAILELELLFDVLQDESSVFDAGQPIFNAGIMFAL
jgi:hypothetical protein